MTLIEAPFSSLHLNPLWLPQVLNQCLSHQCTCFCYMRGGSTDLGSISLEYQTCTSPHPFDTLVTGMPHPTPSPPSVKNIRFVSLPSTLLVNNSLIFRFRNTNVMIISLQIMKLQYYCVCDLARLHLVWLGWPL